MVWSELSAKDKESIKARYVLGEPVDDIAKDFQLKPQSLARKMRKIGIKREVIAEEKGEKDKYKFVLSGGERYYERRLDIYAQETVSFVVISDTHFGSENKIALDATIRSLPNLKFDFMVHAGDALDLYGLSKYGKDHDGIFNRNLGSELDAWFAFNSDLEEITDVDKYILGGNHIRRYYAWLDQNPGVHGVENMELDHLMNLESFGYAPMVNEIFFNPTGSSDFPDPGIIIHHGTLSRKHAGSSSRGESEKLGVVNSISGHVHRLAVNYRRTIRGIATTVEAGCLCNLNPEYMDYPDWTHGFIHCTFNPSTNFLSAIPYSIFNGIVYKDGMEM